MDQISFGTDGWRTRRELFTPERVRAVAQAITAVVPTEGTLVVGYDARNGARDRAKECCRVLAAAGHDVLLAARDCPTPAVAHAIVERALAGGIVITASHNPASYLGVKFIPADGAPALPTVTDEIEANLQPPAPLPPDEHGTVEEVDLITPHVEACLSRITADLDGLTVGYDAMHGSGRGATDRALERAGADVVRLRCSRQPEFGGSPPDPAPEQLEALSDRVANSDVDLGIANDGDADRIAVVTESGVLDPNYTLAVLYQYLLEADRAPSGAPGPVVRTVSTTNLLDEIATDHDTTAHETAVGFKWVAAAMAEHDALLGGEESGGLSIRGHVREKDGILGALLVAAAAADQPLEARKRALLNQYGGIHQDRRSIDCPDEQKAAVITAVRNNPPEEVAGSEVTDQTATDGLKLQLADGTWLLVRASGTEPKLRIYAEARDHDRVRELLAAGEALFDEQL